MIYTLIRREKTDKGTNWITWGSSANLEYFKSMMCNIDRSMIPQWYDQGFMVLTIEENTMKLQKAGKWLIEAGIIEEGEIKS